MTIRDKVRKWLGFIELEAYVAGVEKANRDRHEILCRELESLSMSEDVIKATLERIENGFQERHVNRRPPVAVSRDWEQVQLDELATMLANPPKEEN